MTPRAENRIANGLPADGVTVVSTSFSPDDEGLPMELLVDDLARSDTVILVTAHRPPGAVIETYEERFAGPSTPSLSIVDTTAGQRFEDSYHDVAVTGVPGAEDLARIALAIAELAADAWTAEGDVHVVVPDVAPFLTSDVALVRRMLHSLDDLAAVSGFLAVGIQYTAHDTETMAAITGVADAVVWADRGPDETIRLSAER